MLVFISMKWVWWRIRALWGYTPSCRVRRRKPRLIMVLAQWYINLFPGCLSLQNSLHKSKTECAAVDWQWMGMCIPMYMLQLANQISCSCIVTRADTRSVWPLCHKPCNKLCADTHAYVGPNCTIFIKKIQTVCTIRQTVYTRNTMTTRERLLIICYPKLSNHSHWQKA